MLPFHDQGLHVLVALGVAWVRQGRRQEDQGLSWCVSSFVLTLKLILFSETHTDYSRQATLERHTDLYPIVGAYFRASAVIGSFKTGAAIANLVSSFDTEAVVTLFNLAKANDISNEICDILFTDLVRFNQSAGHDDNKVVFKYEGVEGQSEVLSAYLTPERRVDTSTFSESDLSEYAACFDE
jgi:hypothetical protein